MPSTIDPNLVKMGQVHGDILKKRSENKITAKFTERQKLGFETWVIKVLYTHPT